MRRLLDAHCHSAPEGPAWQPVGHTTRQGPGVQRRVLQPPSSTAHVPGNTSVTHRPTHTIIKMVECGNVEWKGNVFVCTTH